MLTMLTTVVAIFFAGMGLVALAAPNVVGATNGTPSLPPAGRNEVRAVYGGFGLALAALLFAAPAWPALAPGIYLTVAVAVGGMAGGRVVSALIERPESFYPSWFYFVLEMLMAIVFVMAARTPPG